MLIVSRLLSKPKTVLTSSKVLVHYDPSLPLQLADASAYGLGAVIPHTMPMAQKDQLHMPPRSLSASELNYAQLEIASIPGRRAAKNGLVPTARVLMRMRTIPQNLGNPVTSVNYQ